MVARRVDHGSPDSSCSPSEGVGASVASYLKLPHSVIVRAPGLLPMLYRPSELAEELNVAAPTVRDWIEKGLPHQRDRRGHLWIDGRHVIEWVETVRRRPQKPKSGDGEAYCFRCNQSVELCDPAVQRHSKQALLSGTCPHCGGAIYRGSRNG